MTSPSAAVVVIEPIKGLVAELTDGSFPALHYRRVPDITVQGSPTYQEHQHAKRLLVGGSYTVYCERPLYETRKILFERRTLPYPVPPTFNVTVRNGCVLWDRFQERVFTDLAVPDQVYVTDMPFRGRFIARIVFAPDRIVWDDLDVQPVAPPPPPPPQPLPPPLEA